MAKAAGGSSRKIGRNKKKCERYRAEGRREKNRASKAKRNKRRRYRLRKEGRLGATQSASDAR